MSTPKLTYVFVCPECRKVFRTDEPGEPCCTGPNESLDEHPLTVMHLLRANKKEVHPVWAEQRAAGQLIMPYETEVIQRDTRIILNG